MSDVVRFTVSLEADLLDEFDRYCAAENFATRSEAIRQLLRETLTTRAWEKGTRTAVATLTIVYDHHRTQLTEQLLHLQHEHTDMVICTTHVHLDHDNCLEVIILRGKASALREVASRLRGLKGIRQGQLVVASTDKSPS
ncbi:MAG TPA: nickel-responsive transcriptional regulator NikR [Pirellulales bacterium]|nr:nickel-responsive transcriptional regulator NikR [Pirellulales bacterium]